MVTTYKMNEIMPCGLLSPCNDPFMYKGSLNELADFLHTVTERMAPVVFRKTI